MFLDVDVALSGVPVNVLPLLDDTDFKSIESAVAYNAAGMALKWNFVASDGTFTQTAVTPTTAGVYDWNHKGGGMYSMEIPASGGGSINNDTEGYGWFSGVATGVLPWRGPVIGFRAAGLNDLLTDSAYSTTRGLGGTALPNAAAEAAGGLFTRGTGAGQLSQTANGELGVATLAKTVTTYTGNTVQTGDAYARLGAPAGASVSADVAAVKGVLPSALVSGRIDASVGAMASAVLTAAAIAADAITDAKVASDVTIASVTGAVGSVTGNVGGNVTGSVASVVGAVGSVTGLTASNLDVAVSSRLAASSYTAPLDAAATRSAVGLASANLDTQLDALPTNAELATALGTADDAVLAAIAALNNLSSAGAQSAASAALTAYGAALQSTLLTGVSYIDTEVAAIKSKTDNLPASPAATGDIPTAVQNADALLGRTIAGGANGGRMVKDALRFNRNKFTIAGGVLTVYEEDDTTIAWTATVTQTAGDPVSASDPS